MFHNFAVQNVDVYGNDSPQRLCQKQHGRSRTSPAFQWPICFSDGIHFDRILRREKVRSDSNRRHDGLERLRNCHEAWYFLNISTGFITFSK